MWCSPDDFILLRPDVDFDPRSQWFLASGTLVLWSSGPLILWFSGLLWLLGLLVSLGLGLWRLTSRHRRSSSSQRVQMRRQSSIAPRLGWRRISGSKDIIIGAHRPHVLSLLSEIHLNTNVSWHSDGFPVSETDSI